MKKLNKKFLAATFAVLLAFVAVLGISACNSGGSNNGGKFGVSGTEFEVNGQFVVARLNRTSSDTDWNYTVSGKGDMQCESDELSSNGKDCSGNTTQGVVDSHAFRFSADSAGEQTITFTYGNDSSKTVTAKVTTGDKGTVKTVEVSNASGESTSYTVK